MKALMARLPRGIGRAHSEFNCWCVPRHKSLLEACSQVWKELTWSFREDPTFNYFHLAIARENELSLRTNRMPGHFVATQIFTLKFQGCRCSYPQPKSCAAALGYAQSFSLVWVWLSSAILALGCIDPASLSSPDIFELNHKSGQG
jgi:hypothetical protein